MLKFAIVYHGGGKPSDEIVSTCCLDLSLPLINKEYILKKRDHYMKNNFDNDIADLQSKIAYLEMTVDSLDLVIAKQDKRLQEMQRQLQLVYRHINAQSDSEIMPFDVSSEIPPHF